MSEPVSEFKRTSPPNVRYPKKPVLVVGERGRGGKGRGGEGGEKGRRGEGGEKGRGY